MTEAANHTWFPHDLGGSGVSISLGGLLHAYKCNPCRVGWQCCRPALPVRTPRGLLLVAVARGVGGSLQCARPGCVAVTLHAPMKAFSLIFEGGHGPPPLACPQNSACAPGIQGKAGSMTTGQMLSSVASPSLHCHPEESCQLGGTRAGWLS